VQRGNIKPTRKYDQTEQCGCYLFSINIKVYPDTWTKIIYLLIATKIARSFEFRNIANCIQIVDLYITVLKGLIARQKTIKLALGIAETNDHGICQSIAVC
jgi:hypothetical protein